jgi:hypothetical protein
MISTEEKLAYLAKRGEIRIRHTPEEGFDVEIFDGEGYAPEFEAQSATLDAAVDGVFVQVGESLESELAAAKIALDAFRGVEQ